MPKAVAPEPAEWATGRYGFQDFDLHELYQVVRDYAFIELHNASHHDLPSRSCHLSALADGGAGVVLLGAVGRGDAR